MRVLAFNGSPRKQWNTATLLAKALEGAASQGAETDQKAFALGARIASASPNR